MAQTWYEIEHEYNNHKSYDRIIKNWDGTKLTGAMVQDLLPTISYTQTDKNGVKYYTDPEQPIRLTSVLSYGGYPEDVYEYRVCGYIRTASAYARELVIRMYNVNDQEVVYYGGDFILGGFDTFDYATPIYKDDHGTITYDMKGKANGVAYPGVGTVTANWFWSDDSQYYPNTNTSDGVNDVESEFIRYIECPQIPIFETYEDLEEYVKTGDTSKVINADNDYNLDTTKYYFIYNNQGSAKLFNGTIAPVSGTTYAWHSLKFSANSEPVLYYDDAFGLSLVANNVVASKAVTGPGYIIDNIPEEGWTEGELEYSGPFYGTLPGRIEACGSLPENGTYSYGFECNTNILVAKDLATAQYIIETGDYTAASNYYDIKGGNTHLPVNLGDNETATTFGSGYATSPFVSSYICDRNDVLNVAGAFYSNDTTLIDNIKKGLELFGANPFEAICGLSWFPFDLNTVATAQPQTWIYFGSYKHQPAGLSIDKIINMNASGYINAGSVYIGPLFNSYRDFEPYCQLSVFLPYSGWHELDIAKYYKKTVNIRYYVDIFTNTFACALVIDNQICDIFNGNIGVTLPICGSNLSEYANSMLRSVLGTVGGTAGGALSGAMLGGGIPGAVIGATVGGFAGLAKGTFEMAQKGQPKDHLQVKGAFSGASSSYMPQYVIFRYDVHDLIVPDNLTALQGRPSSAGGKIGSFSGYLQCDTIKLNTGRMTDAEINETIALLRNGIFV